MDPARQRAAALDHLSALGVPRLAREPLLYRLAWRMGLHLKPPHFGHFLPNAVMASIPCSVASAAAFTALTTLSARFDASSVPEVSLAVGAYFGVAMALYYRYSARWLELGPWSALDAAEGAATAGLPSGAAPAARPAPAPRPAAPAPIASRPTPRR